MRHLAQKGAGLGPGGRSPCQPRDSFLGLGLAVVWRHGHSGKAATFALLQQSMPSLAAKMCIIEALLSGTAIALR